MSQKEINDLIELSKKSLEEKTTKEKSLTTFIEAGILDANGKFTKPYEELSKIIISE